MNNSDFVITEEIYLCQEKCDKIDVSKSVIDIFGECNIMIFPYIYKLLKILITLPVTTAIVKRLFSILKRLKTYIRNSTTGSGVFQKFSGGGAPKLLNGM